MKNYLRPLTRGALATLGVAAFCLSVQAQNLTLSTSSTGSWLGTPVFLTGSTPTGGSGGTTQDNDSWGGNANGTGGFGALAMAFTVSSSGTAANFQMVFAGAAANFNVELYDMGATPSGYPGTVGGAAPITQINNIGGAPPSGTLPTLSGGVNLLQAGDNVAFGGTGGTTLLTLTLGGADSNVQLNTGELYVLSLDPTGANADNTWWDRGGVPITGYNTGEGLNADGMAGLQNFEGKSSIRDFDLGVDEVPEPSTMALLGLGGVWGAFILRRKQP